MNERRKEEPWMWLEYHYIFERDRETERQMNERRKEEEPWMGLEYHFIFERKRDGQMNKTRKEEDIKKATSFLINTLHNTPCPKHSLFCRLTLTLGVQYCKDWMTTLEKLLFNNW